MPRPKNPVPTYRLHKQSGQAIVTVNVNGARKDMLLGVYNSAESKEEYRRVLTDLAAGRFNTSVPADLTVNELCARYWKHAQEYYLPDRMERKRPNSLTSGTRSASSAGTRATCRRESSGRSRLRRSASEWLRRGGRAQRSTASAGG